MIRLLPWGIDVGDVVAFRLPGAEEEGAEPEIDLLTAVDVAVRDLGDIIRHWGSPPALKQAEACHRLLLRSFDRARGEC